MWRPWAKQVGPPSKDLSGLVSETHVDCRQNPKVVWFFERCGALPDHNDFHFVDFRQNRKQSPTTTPAKQVSRKQARSKQGGTSNLLRKAVSQMIPASPKSPLSPTAVSGFAQSLSVTPCTNSPPRTLTPPRSRPTRNWRKADLHVRVRMYLPSGACAYVCARAYSKRVRLLLCVALVYDLCTKANILHRTRHVYIH